MIIRLAGFFLCLFFALVIFVADFTSNYVIEDSLYLETVVSGYSCSPKRVGNLLYIQLDTGERLIRNNKRSDLSCQDIEEVFATLSKGSLVKVWFTDQYELMQLDIREERVFDFNATVEKKRRTRINASLFLVFLAFFILIDLIQKKRSGT